MISSFISIYYFNTLFIKTNSSWLIFEAIKVLEIKTSMLFDLDFANNIVLSCFFFLIIDKCFLIAAGITQIFYPTTELVIPIVIPTKEAEAEMETHPVLVEPKIRKRSI